MGLKKTPNSTGTGLGSDKNVKSKGKQLLKIHCSVTWLQGMKVHKAF